MERALKIKPQTRFSRVRRYLVISFEFLSPSLPLVHFLSLWASCSNLPRCAPCTAFAPLLATAYPALRAQSCEVLLVSHDQDAVAVDAHRAHMPWPTLPFHSPRGAALASSLAVTTLPAFVVLDRDTGEVRVSVLLASSECTL
jgi:hypothetical protein